MNPRVQHKLGILFSSWEAHMLYGLVVSGPWNLAHYGWFLPETRIVQSSRVCLVKQLTPQLFTLNLQPEYLQPHLINSNPRSHIHRYTHKLTDTKRFLFFTSSTPFFTTSDMSVPQNAPHLPCTSASKSTIQELAACKLTLVANMNCTLLKRRRS